MHEHNTPILSNADNALQWRVGLLTGISWRVYIQHTHIHPNIRSFRFKGRHSPIYSIQRDVLRTFESLKSQV